MNLNRITFLAIICFGFSSISAQNTEFTYQGNLKVGTPPNSTAASGNYDFEFRLFDAATNGSQLGTTITRNSVAVDGGNFSVKLDFGPQFPGANRFLAISVRQSGGGAFTPLDPRQSLSSSPYSVRSLNAANSDTAANAVTAANAQQLGGVAADQFVLTTDPRMSDARPPTAGSSNYIQNSANQLPGTFNLIGNGSVTGPLSALRFDIGPNRMLSIFDTNLFVGREAGREALPGLRNSFFGYFTGPAIDTGVENSLFGFQAGNSIVAGNRNVFFGKDAGRLSQGSENSFFGTNTATSDLGGSQNTLFGFSSNVGSNNLTNATAIGARALVSSDNSLVLGSVNNLNGASADTNVGIGTPSPTQRLHVVGNGLFSGNLTVNGTLNATVSNATNAVNATTAQNVSGIVAIANGGTGSSTKNFVDLTTSQTILGNKSFSQTASFTGANITSLTSIGSATFNGSVAFNNAEPITVGGTMNVGGSVNADQLSAGEFSINGNGSVVGTLTGNIVSATTHYNIGNDRILATHGNRTNLVAGIQSGASITTGGSNAFFGFLSGTNNTSGFNNSFFGSATLLAGFGTGGSNTSGSFNSFFGHRSGERNTNGNFNSFIGTGAGIGNTLGNSNTFVGHDAGNINTSGSFNTVIGENADLGAPNLTNATAIGSKAAVSLSNSLILGSINGANGATADTNVGIGTTAPAAKLHVSGVGAVRARINSTSNTGLAFTLNDQPGWSVATVAPGQFQIFNDAIGQNAVWIDPTSNNVGIGTVSSTAKLDVGGTVRVGTIGIAGISQVCFDASFILSSCSSSGKYKNNIGHFTSGLELIKKLRPVTFNWKTNNMQDLGLVAEEVAKIEPLLVTHNDKGEVEGVKYDRIGVVLLNAVKEQQTQIEGQQKQIENQKETNKRLQMQINLLIKQVCKSQPSSELCIEKE